MRNDLDKRLTSHDPDHKPSEAAAADAPAKLRRWSVAELLARAVPRPPAGGIAH